MTYISIRVEREFLIKRLLAMEGRTVWINGRSIPSTHTLYDMYSATEMSSYDIKMLQKAEVLP